MDDQLLQHAIIKGQVLRLNRAVHLAACWLQDRLVASMHRQGLNFETPDRPRFAIAVLDRRRL